MFIDKYPNFTTGRILKQEMLALLRDYPRDYVNIIYGNYADGIIAGCGITVDSAALNISPGMVRFRGRIYVLTREETVSYRATGQDSVVKICFAKEKQTPDYISAQADITFSQGLKIAENEMELCRFKLKPGARLRDNYQDFADMATEYDTLNIINAPFAAPYANTLSPVITRKFAEEAFQTRELPPFDFAFAAQCAQGVPLARATITAYTSARLGIVSNDSANRDMHRHLAKILSDIRQGKSVDNAGSRRRNERRIFVD